MWLAIVLVACGSGEPIGAVSEDGGFNEPRLLTPAEAVAVADLDGDGFDEPILVQEGVIRWNGREHAIDCTVQVVSRRRVAGQSREEALLGCGTGRQTRGAPLRILAVGEDSVSTIWSRDGERNQIADLRVVEGRIWVAAFSTKFDVEAGWIQDGVFQKVTEGRLATQQFPLSGTTVLQGRVYGEAPRSPGDLRVVGPGVERILPTWRGVRSLELADLNEDGHLEILVGDGWHYAYAEQARARLLLLEGPDWTVGRTLGFFSDDYSIRSIELVEDGIVAVGTRHVHWLNRDELGWVSKPIAEITETGMGSVIKTDSGLGVLVSGSPAKIVPIP